MKIENVLLVYESSPQHLYLERVISKWGKETGEDKQKKIKMEKSTAGPKKSPYGRTVARACRPYKIVYTPRSSGRIH